MAGGDFTIQFNATGTFDITGNRDYVDATCFGDTHRTYLVGTGTPERAVGTMVNPLTAITNKMAQKRSKKHREAVRALYNKVVGLTNDLSEEMAAAGIVAQTTAEMITQLSIHMRDVEREEAIEKAEWLLDRHMTDEQRKTWAKNHWMRIDGKDANTYRIDRDGNVSVWRKKGTDKGWTKRGTFCMYTTDPTMPVADKILATKMYLEANEEGYLAEANYSDMSGYAFRKLQVNGELVPLPKTTRRNAYEGMIQAYGDWLTFDEPIRMRLGDFTRPPALGDEDTI